MCVPEHFAIAAFQRSRFFSESVGADMQTELSGPFGLKLFRLAWEFILRKQVEALVKHKKFPPAIEQVVKELWALRALIALEQGVDLNSEDVPIQGTAGSASLSSTDNDSERDSDSGEDTFPRLPLPKLLEMFALCYLAADILRVPLPVSSLHRWIVTGELVYVKAHDTIPVEMRNKFGRRFHSVFIVLRPLAAERLHLVLAEECRLLLTRFTGMKLPPLNWNPLLLDHLMRIGLPLHMYTCVESMSGILGIDFTFPSPRERARTGYIGQLPELRLVALIVFSVKLYHPFSGKEYFATSISDPGFLTIDWSEWQKSHARMEDALRNNGQVFAPGEEIGLEPADVYRFSGQQMDAYMDWFSNTWLESGSSGKRKTTDRTIDVPEGIREMFPLKRNISQKPDPVAQQNVESDSLLQLLREVYTAAKTRRIVSEGRAGKGRRSIPRAGAHYERYRLETELDAQPAAKAFHRKTAQVAGISVATLIKVVWRLEELIFSSRDKIAEFVKQSQMVEISSRMEEGD